MKKRIVRIISLVLCLVTVCSLCASAYAASNPPLSKTNYCEFKAHKKINVYRNKDRTIRGTCSPADSYDAYIAKGDICYIYKITSFYVQVNYPSRAGRSTGYINLSDLDLYRQNPFSLSEEYTTDAYYSYGSAETFNSHSGSHYGWIETKDTVYLMQTFKVIGNNVDHSRYAVMYTAKSGKRGYKFGWVNATDFNKICKR